MKRSTGNKKIYICGILLVLILWELLSEWIGQKTMVFPGPFSTFSYAFVLLKREYTWRCISATMRKMLEGFGISLFLGFLLGIPAGNDERISILLKPLITTLRAIPTASLVYLFIVLAGFRQAPVCLVVMIGFPIIYEGVMTGIANVESSYIDAARLDGASFLQENCWVRIPLAFPYILAAMASAFSLSFKIEIMAEVITGASVPGLGSAISGARAADPTNMVPVFGYSLIAVGMMLLIDFSVSFLREKIAGK